MEVLSKTTILFILIVSIYGTFTNEPTPPNINLNEENMQDLEHFFKNNPDLYAKLQKIERLVSDPHHNATEVKLLQDKVMMDMQPRIIESCDEVFFNKHRELYDRVFLYRNATKSYNISILNLQNKELMTAASMLAVYRDELTKFVKTCIRKGASSLKRGERTELHRRINESLLKSEDVVRKAIKHHSEFEMSLDVKQTFCHNIVDKWLEEHFVEMEKMVIIEQRQTFIPIKDELRRKMIHQCFIFVTLQKEYVATCVNNACKDVTCGRQQCAEHSHLVPGNWSQTTPVQSQLTDNPK